MASSSSSSDVFESEVRTGSADTRKYFVATFPEADKDPAYSAAAAKGAEHPQYPQFGKKSWPAPVYLMQEEVEQKLSDDEMSEDDEEPGGFKKFKRRRVYKTLTENKWVLTDKKRKQVLHGEPEGQTARYFVIVPPPPPSQDEDFMRAEDRHFRVLPVHQWLKFKRPPNFTALKASEARALQEKNESLSKIVNFMEERQRKRQAEAEGDGVMENTRGHAGSKARRKQRLAMGDEAGFEVDPDSRESLLLSDDDQETKKKKRGGKGNSSAVAGDSDDESDSEEEDITVMAIDRKDHGRGEGNGDADYQEEFANDQDDADQIKEEEDAVANEDELIKGAEEVAGGLSDSDEDADSDDDDDESDADEVNNTVEAFLQKQRDGAIDEEDEDEERVKIFNASSQTKVVHEDRKVDQGESAAASSTGPAGVASSASSPTPAGGKRPLEGPAGSGKPAKISKTPQVMFREAVIESIRQSGGQMDVQELRKQVTNKKILKQTSMEKAEANKLLLQLLKDLCDLSEDKITNRMIAKLKEKYV